MMGRKKSFVIRYDTLWRGLIQMRFFTDKEKAVLADLSAYLSYDNSIVLGKRSMNVTEMAEAIGMDVGNFSRVLKSLIKKNAIGYFASGDGGRKTYYMNPELYCKGEPKPWLERQFAHKAYVDWQENGAEIIELHRYRSTLTLPKENKTQTYSQRA